MSWRAWRLLEAFFAQQTGGSWSTHTLSRWPARTCAPQQPAHNSAHTCRQSHSRTQTTPPQTHGSLGALAPPSLNPASSEQAQQPSRSCGSASCGSGRPPPFNHGLLHTPLGLHSTLARDLRVEGPAHNSWIGRSAFSSSSDSAASDLKTGLRRLYKKVHPDMCGSNLQARAENERSFKLLQEYLGKAKASAGDARSPSATQAIREYRFAFYLRDHGTQASPAQQQEAADKSGPGMSHSSSGDENERPESAGSSFRKVEVSLKPPPPAPPSGPKDPDAPDPFEDLRLHPEARSGLVRLMQACGIEVSLSSRYLEEEEASMSQQRLSIFLPDAVEALRRAESGSVSDNVRAATIRGAMRLQRKVLASIRNSSNIPPNVQVAALHTLASVLDSAELQSIDVSGCNIIIGHGAGIDRLGNLLLDIGQVDHLAQSNPHALAAHFSSVALDWRDMLLDVDMDFVKGRKAYVQAVRELEGGVATSLGVAAVFGTNPQHLIAEPSYREFLERLAAASIHWGPIGQKQHHHHHQHHHAHQQQQLAMNRMQQRFQQRQHQQHLQQQKTGLPFQDVPISVWSEYAFVMDEQHLKQQQQQGEGAVMCVVDEQLGALRLHDALSAEQVYAAVSKYGAKARAAMQRNRQREADVQHLVERVRRALRLRRLMKDERLSNHHFQAACLSLLEQADALTHTLEGSSVRISFTNRVAPDSSYIDIAYNFRL